MKYPRIPESPGDDDEESSGCALNGEWHEFRKEFSEAANKISETHNTLHELIEHAEHLRKLDTIATSIGDIKNGLLVAATGRDQVSAKIALQVAKILGWVIMGLVVILVALLTGQHFGWITQVR